MSHLLQTIHGKNPKVRDHCHYTGRYRGAAHRNCNLQYKIRSYIPVVFHNLSGYDAHLFIRELAASKPGGAKMDVIAKNKEDYITFSIRLRRVMARVQLQNRKLLCFGCCGFV